MRNYIRILSVCTTLLGLCACTSTPNKTLSDVEENKPVFPVLSSAEFGDPVVPGSEDEIFKLSDSQISDFLNYYNDPKYAEKQGHTRLYEYLRDFGENFTYSEQTKNAINTLSTASGNCMSLAVLTTALARVADLKIKYQLVKRTPVYQKYGSVIFNLQHVRTVVSDPVTIGEDGVISVSGKSIIDYYPGRYSSLDRYITKDEFLGRYYTNLAAEALGEGKASQSFWLAKYSLEIDETNMQAVNSLAVLNRRIGELEIAENLYAYGLELTENKIALLKNYQVLLKQQKRFDEAAELAKKIATLNDKNPFDKLQEAEKAYVGAEYSKALSLYLEVVDFAPYLHQAYFGIAKTEYKRGNVRAAKEALERAMQETFDDGASSIYAAKLAVLGKT